MNKRLFFSWTALEFLLLCIVFPGIIIFGGHGKMMFAFLWSATIYCAVIYRFQLHSKLRRIWSWSAVNWSNMGPMLMRWIMACAGMYLFMLYYDPDKLFRLLDRDPRFLLIMPIFYTFLSALPQEFIFCTFFFRRYAWFFGRGKWMILASSVVFAYAHALYANPVAPSLSFIAGLIFAHTYYKTKSLALVTIEHGLYGTAMFIIGLGYYFWSGGIGS